MMLNSSAELETFPLSLLSQYGFCPRRCALLILDQAWEDNEYTAAGSIEHQRVHTMRTERHGEDIYLYELAVYSRRLGINGKCDCVEAHSATDGVSLPYAEGTFRLYPVEYKHGTVRRKETEYQIQLCAQAMCLEEQFGCSIPAGAIFFCDAHRRDEVELTLSLREQTAELTRQIRLLQSQETLPPATYCAKCKKCSMLSICEPKLKQTAKDYCRSLWDQILKEDKL